MGEGKPLHRHAPFPVWPLSKNSPSREQSGSGALGRAPRKVNVWRLPSPPLWLRAFLARKAKSLAFRRPAVDRSSPPPVVLPDRRGPRGGLCRCGGAAKRARASDENFQPRFRHATGPAPPPSLIPGAHQVPARAMPAIMREAERAWIKKFRFLHPSAGSRDE